MSQYTNAVHVAVNENNTEVFINFSVTSVDAENNQTVEPVSSLVMTGDLAAQLATIIANVMKLDIPRQE